MAVAFFVVLSFYRAPVQGVGWLWVAMGLFIAAALSDVLDGWLARRWQVVSLFGRIMDPLCDKLLVLGGFVVLAGPRFTVTGDATPWAVMDSASGVYPWVVVVLLARELLVTAIRGVAESRGMAFPARAAGKIKMFVQSVSLPVIMGLMAIDPPQFHPGVFWTNHILVWLTVVVTIWSGLPYIAAVRALERDS
jgi:CDP-diacylglycerol--glycerol-3-phosphate 3-phosphatidyltransferase